MDGFDLAIRCCDNHLFVQRDPRADADKIERFFIQHLTVILIGSGKRRTVPQNSREPLQRDPHMRQSPRLAMPDTLPRARVHVHHNR